VKRDGNTVSVSFEERGAKVVKGYLLYTNNRGDRNEEWFRQKATLNGNGSLSAELPEDTTQYLFTLVDENNFLVSYPELDEQPAAQAAVKAKKNRARTKVREPKKAAKPLPGDKQGTTVPEQRTQEWWLPRHKEKVAQAKAGNIDLVMIGDSITQAWEKQKKYAEIFAGYNTLNLGFGGDRTQNVLWRIEHGEIDGIAPKLVTVMIGTNNSRRDKPDQIFQGIKAIVAELRGRLPEAKIVLFSIFPRKPGRENDTIMVVNARLPELADRKQVFHVDINPRFLDENGNQITELYNRDLLHLSSKGYETWFKALQPLIEGNRPFGGHRRPRFPRRSIPSSGYGPLSRWAER
jgi:lysophospholipase L1-like esterase